MILFVIEVVLKLIMYHLVILTFMKECLEIYDLILSELINRFETNK